MQYWGITLSDPVSSAAGCPVKVGGCLFSVSFESSNAKALVKRRVIVYDN